ncbi:MAG: glycosyltransferase [Candidatus Orphnella occulta]|nr:glycosyltransferase [Candidatus Orphnella occulta]
MYLIILGTLPPPRGGVSTHIERLIPYLEEVGIEFVVWDSTRIHKKHKNLISLRKEPLKAIRSLMLPRVKILHHPLSDITFFRLLFFFAMRLMGTRLTITFIGSPAQTLKNSSLKLFYFLTLARLSTHVIIANRDFYKLLVDNGISETKVSVIPAFIPLNNKFIHDKPIPRDALEFCIKHKPLITTYAYGPNIYNKEDLYGLDLIVQLAKELRIDLPNAGFVVIIPDITEETYFQQLKDCIQHSGLKSLFHFAVGNHFSFIPFLQHADLFIRATNTDGDSLTLREAVYYGVPSVASDVCPRPEETSLFHNRDAKDLSRAVRKALTKGKDRECAMPYQKENNARLFIDVFNQVAGARG